MFGKKIKLNLKFSYLCNFKEKDHQMRNIQTNTISRKKNLKFEI